MDKNIFCNVYFTTILLFLPEVTGGGHELVEEMAGGNRTIQLLIIIFLAKLFLLLYVMQLDLLVEYFYQC